jgi:methionine-rich copper-binding protein CopC
MLYVMTKTIFAIACLLFAYLLPAQTTLIPYGSNWKYLANGTNQGTAWRATSFNDASWSGGNAQLGYGDGDEATVVSYGPNANSKYITTYFRKTITVANASVYTEFTLSIKRDDGAVVYINGTERFRTNMPASTISYNTRASSDAPDDGNTPQTISLATGTLVTGTNVIAVEIHQRTPSSSDISFDLQLTATGDVTDPTVTAFSPADNATNTTTTANLVLTFSEAVQKGTGNILVKESGVTTQTIDVTSAAVTVAGNTVTIDAANFTNSAAVNIEIEAGAFKDLADNNYAGIADAITWNFTIIDADITPPDISIYSPTDNSTNIAVNANLVFSFTETIQKGTGNIVVKENGITAQTIDVTAASVTVAGNTVTIDPANFTNSAAVNIEIEAGAFKDLADNNYAGIGDAGTWNFTIIDADITAPTVTNYSPADNTTDAAISSNLVLTFSEPVQKGAGNILIKENGITTQTIDVTAATVTVAGNTVTIDPADFANSAAVNIEIAAGAFKDFANNDYAGISDATTWNFSTVAPPSGPETLVAYGASWKYLDNGTNQGAAWRAAAFNDASWVSGNAQLGYGDGDEATVVSYGPSATAKYITTYFRKTIFVSNPSNFSSILGSVKRDDGIAIYVNGTEVYRNNLAAGAGYTTLATLASDDGATAQAFSFSPSALVSGNNVIAVEIHQNAANSSDISFDLQLIGTVPGAALLTRGPYLNMGNENAVTLRWKTDVATNSKVELGTSFGTYPIVVSDPASATEHEVRITGLNADTKYFYRFGSSIQALQQGTDNYFITAPLLTTTRKIRIAAFGDCGRNDNLYQSGTLSSYQSYTGSNPAEVMLLLGDNAYDNGTDAEYQSRFFDVYSSNLLKNHQLFPAPGNHDYANNATRQADHNIPYNSIFTNPAAAECGGVASGTEAYYSWNWGNIHFLSLDSYGKENAGTTRLYDTTGAQAVWVKNDLGANTRPWVIAYWHHPPFTMGSHNSDTETELISMRQNFIRILERYGVDLIICGHSHDYERSYLLKNYFGTEATFNAATHAASNSSAKYDGSANSCPYLLAPGQVNHGTVYVVAGSAGASGATQAGYPHNAMPWSVNDGGMMYFEIEGNRLDAKFIRRTGVIADQFTIMKDANKTTDLSITSGTPTELTASWNGSYLWSTGETTKTITVAPVSNTTYTVSDGASSCVTDIFNVTISSGQRMANPVTTVNAKPLNSLQIIPSFVKKGRLVNVQAKNKGIMEAALVDINGRIIKIYKFNGSFSIETSQLQRGVYFLRFTDGNAKIQSQKFLVTD